MPREPRGRAREPKQDSDRGAQGPQRHLPAQSRLMRGMAKKGPGKRVRITGSVGCVLGNRLGFWTQTQKHTHKRTYRCTQKYGHTQKHMFVTFSFLDYTITSVGSFVSTGEANGFVLFRLALVMASECQQALVSPVA